MKIKNKIYPSYRCQACNEVIELRFDPKIITKWNNWRCPRCGKRRKNENYFDFKKISKIINEV